LLDNVLSSLLRSCQRGSGSFKQGLLEKANERRFLSGGL